MAGKKGSHNAASIDSGKKGGVKRPNLGTRPGGHDGGKKDASRRGVK